MNLGELRLKALQSLKRPYSSTNTDETISSSNAVTKSTEPVTSSVTSAVTTPILNPFAPPFAKPCTENDDREEGEITDDTISEAETGSDDISDSERENDSNSSNEYFKYNNTRNSAVNGKRYGGGYSKKPRNTTWTRSGYHHRNNFYNYLSDESDSEITEINDKFDLESLLNFKVNLLSRIDEAQSILAANEEREHDLMDQLEECRNLQNKCENERYRLEKQLEKIEKRINFKEKMKFDNEKEVSKNNFKKNFVGKMMKETYMRSFVDRFRNSSLFRIYDETLKLDRRLFNRIDPMTPLCTVELMDGKCPYYPNGTCSMQHIEEIMKDDRLHDT